MNVTTKRILASVASFAILGSVMAGCGSKQEPGTGAQAPADTKPKTLVLAYSDGGTTVDPVKAGDLTSDTLTLATYDTLVQYGTKTENGREVADTANLKPMLAESWTVSPDGLTYTFKIRQAKFQNGDPVTAQAVKWSFDRLYNVGSSGKFFYQVAGLKGPDNIKAVDDRTLEVKLDAPSPTFMQTIALYTWAVVNPKVGQEKGDDWLAKNTEGAGSGPFKMVSWNPATEAVFEANKDYWAGAPKVDKVIFKFVKEDANRLMLLQNGDADLAIEIPAKDTATLKANAKLNVSTDASGRMLMMMLNTKKAPFDNVKVRQAISYAVPYQDLTEKVMYGQATQSKSPLPSFMPMYDGSSWQYNTNLEKAKQLLAEAGYPDGFSFDFVLGSGFSDWEEDAVLIQANLAKINVKMNIQKMPRAEFLQVIKKGETQAFITKWTSFVNDPAYHLGFLLQTGGSSNYAQYSNPAVDAMLNQAGKLLKQEERAPIYKEAQKQIVNDAPWVFLYEYNRIVAMGKDVKGYVFYQDELIRPYMLSK